MDKVEEEIKRKKSEEIEKQFIEEAQRPQLERGNVWSAFNVLFDKIKTNYENNLKNYGLTRENMLNPDINDPKIQSYFRDYAMGATGGVKAKINDVYKKIISGDIDIVKNTQGKNFLDFKDGQLIFNTSFLGSDGKLRDFAENYYMKKAEKLANGEDVYYRLTNNKNEIPNFYSKNHATGNSENGLSVSTSPHYGVWGYKYAYKVKGKRIGTGSDGEPLLDPKSIEVLGKKENPNKAIENWIKKVNIELNNILGKQ